MTAGVGRGQHYPGRDFGMLSPAKMPQPLLTAGNSITQQQHACPHAGKTHTTCNKSQKCQNAATASPPNPWQGKVHYVLVHMWAGEDRHDSIAARTRLRKNWECEEWDWKRKFADGLSQDMRLPCVRERLLRSVSRPEVRALVAGIPCTTMAITHGLRPGQEYRLPGDELMGKRDLTDEKRQFVDWANVYIRLTFEAARIVAKRGGQVAIENGSRRDVPPAYWEARAHMITLWHLPCTVEIIAELRLRTRHTSHCMRGGRGAQKCLTWAFTDGAYERVDNWLPCNHSSHPEQAKGTDSNGKSIAESYGSYPKLMCEDVVYGVTNLPPSQVQEEGGRVTDGPDLNPSVRALVETARTLPHAWSSTRTLEPATRDELRRMPFPEPAPPPTRPEELDSQPPQVWSQHPDQPPESLCVEMFWYPGILAIQDNWCVRAGEKLIAMASGDPDSAPTPETLIFTDADQPEWARGGGWDARDRNNVIRTARSTIKTTFPGDDKMVNRGAFLDLVEKLGWRDIDPDICDQIPGGIESRSTTPPATILAFHQTGALSQFETINDSVRRDVAASWATTALRLPYIHCNLMPLNVIQQAKTKVEAIENPEPGGPTHKVIDRTKPRITSHLSYRGKARAKPSIEDLLAGGDFGTCIWRSINDGVDEHEKSVGLPCVRSMGAIGGIVSEARANDNLKAQAYCFDDSSAYRYVMMQMADWHGQCYIWILKDKAGKWYVVICIDGRLVFGGAFGPNRFQRLGCITTQATRDEQDRYDAKYPYPEGTRAWSELRMQFAKEGLLPNNRTQWRPCGIQRFIDDGCGVSLNDPTPPIPELMHIPLQSLTSATAGGDAIVEGTRVATHGRIAISKEMYVHFVIEHSKTDCGSMFIHLGSQLDTNSQRITCPVAKQQVMMRDTQTMLEAVKERSLIRGPTETLIGRLTNWSHIEPSIKPYLCAGYGAVKMFNRTSHKTRPGKPNKEQRLAIGNNTEFSNRFSDLLHMAHFLLTSNVGVCMAPSPLFPSTWSKGALTIQTDASGADDDDGGGGGFLYSTEAPNVVFIIHARTRADVRDALRESARPKAEKTKGAPSLSMPAYELFWSYLAVAAARRAGIPVSSVTAVTDCKPAAGATNAGASPVPQLNHLLQGMQSLCPKWLGVAIPRELNQDPDRLSHPSKCAAVRKEAVDANWRVVDLDVQEYMWDVAAHMATLRPWEPDPNDERPWHKQKA